MKNTEQFHDSKKIAADGAADGPDGSDSTTDRSEILPTPKSSMFSSTRQLRQERQQRGLSLGKRSNPGITVADVLRVFPGARVITETKPAAQGPQQLQLIQSVSEGAA
jgi:hypothetical protein